MNRAYSTFTVRAIDDDQRVIEGIASTPEVDRMGDIVEPKGAEFKLPIPLLWQHDRLAPIGDVVSAKVTADGIHVKARVLKIDEPGTLKERLDEAWQSIKHRLVKGLSIGFKPIEYAFMDDGGMHFVKWQWLELSAVTIGANETATITAIKAADTATLAASGLRPPAAVAASRSAISARKDSRSVVKTIQEQIKDFEATRETKQTRMTELMTKAADAGETLDQAAADEYDRLETEVKAVNDHLQRLVRLEEVNRTKAVVVSGTTQHQGTESRSGSPVITVNAPKLPPGIGFARYVMCQINSQFTGIPAYELAKQVYPDYHELHQFMMKAAVPAGTTTQAVWASPLVDQTTLASEFIEYLRPMTIIGRLPALRRVPFNVRIPRQSGNGTGYWVGQGAPKPLTSFAYDAVTLTYMKVAAIAVITQELARFSNPSAEGLVRDALRDVLVERLDIDFIDPANAGSANVSPASVTNGLTAQTSAGPSADNARTDLAKLLNEFVSANVNPTSLALIMPNSLALALSVMVNSLGQPEFPGLNMNGGTLNGIPVVASQYAANPSGAGNMVIAINQSDIFLADDGGVTIDASREASLEMLDNPTNNSATANPTTMVSMFQTNSVALRAEREITWTKRRTSAVVYMDDVNWGSIGSPA